MRRLLNFLSTLSVFLVVQNVQAQPGLWGLRSMGGKDDMGLIFRTDSDGTGYQEVKSFPINNPGRIPVRGLVRASNDKLYGVTLGGGAYDDGVIFEYDPSSSAYNVLFDFSGGEMGRAPDCKLMQAGNGKLYGMTTRGGTHDKGVIFEYDLSSGTYLKKADFDSLHTGAYPAGGLIEVNGKFYGLCPNGGANGLGTLFEFDNSSNILSGLSHFDGSGNGSSPNAGLTLSPNGKLYGVTTTGGAFDQGVVFEFNPVNGSLVKKIDFEPGAPGIVPFGTLVQSVNGKMYGMGKGGLFEFDVVANTFTIKQSGIGGTFGGVMEASNGKLYCTIHTFGSDVAPWLYEYDVSTNLPSAPIIFGNQSNYGPAGSCQLVEAGDGNLYGLADTGGAVLGGSLFEYGIATHELKEKIFFNAPVDGAHPAGNLTRASDGKFYGMTRFGGVYNKGVIYEYDTTAHILAKRLDLSPETGCLPYGSLIQATNGKLYGLTSEGGANNKGVLFEFDPVTSVYTRKVDFAGDLYPYGSSPKGGLIQGFNGRLYGLANLSGDEDGALFFEYDLVTDKLKKGNLAGNHPGVIGGRPVQTANGKIYFTNGGSLVEFQPTNYPYLNYSSISGGDHFALVPYSDWLFAFWGAEPIIESQQPDDVYGIVSTLSMDTVMDQRFYLFKNTIDGVTPMGQPILYHGKIYGLTSSGGANGHGTLYEFDPTDFVVTKKSELTGGTAAFLATSIIAVEPLLEQTVSFDLPETHYKDPPFAIGGMPTSGLPLQYTSSDPSIASVSDGVISVHDIGTTVITASQSGNGTFSPVEVHQTLTVLPSLQTISFAPIADVAITDISIELTPTASSNLPITLFAQSDHVTINGNVATLQKTGHASITAFQNGNDHYTSAVPATNIFCINPAKPLITIASSSEISATLQSSSSTGNQWFRDGELIAGATSDTWEADATGTYQVQVNDDGCLSEFSTGTDVLTGIEPAAGNGISVYPNPAEAYLEIKGIEDEGVSFKVYDMTGKLTGTTVQKANEIYIANLAALSPGIYLLQVHHPKWVRSFKFMIR